MKNEKKFLQPEAEIVRFLAEDIIVTSGPFDDSDDVGTYDPGDIH